MSENSPSASLPGGAPANPGPRSPPRRRRWVWVLLAVVAMFGLLGVVAVRRQSAARTRAAAGAPTGPVPVSATFSREGEMGVYVSALGSVTPVYTVMVHSRVDGQLVSVNYQQGDLVHEGEVLVEIDPRPFEAQLLQAQGQYERDKALLENALLDLKRYQTAFTKNAVPEQTVATAQATVHQDQGTVKLDQALVDNARLQLSYCRISSPITGRVGLRLVDPGNIVHATDTNPMVIVTQVQPITVVFSVAEDYLPQIQQQLRKGQRLAVEALDRSQQHKLADGYVEALDNLIDPSTGTLKLRARFQNDQGDLFPNQFVNIRLLVDTLRDVTLVPGPTVQRNSQGAFVYLIKTNQTVALQAVQPLATEGDLTAVKGLEPGQRIAADNFNRLQEGARVSLRQSSAGTNSSPANAFSKNLRFGEMQ